jgi:mono/diheme cytochrome c family protein
MLNRSEKLLIVATAGLVLLGGWIVATKGPGKEEEPAPKQEVKTASALDIPACRALIDRLDALFQKRFQTVQDEQFGVRRITPLEDIGTHRLWRNDPAVGKIAVQLNRKGLETYFLTVALMRGPTSWGAPTPHLYELTGRDGQPVRLLTREEAQRIYAGKPRLFRDGKIRTVDYRPSLSTLIPITQPVAVASLQFTPPTPPGVPGYPELRSGIDESIAALKTSAAHAFRTGEWAVLARPIRASGKCVSCHQGPDGRPARPGDTLGLALYMVKVPQPDQQFAAQAPALKGVR